jgi:V/A-type H+-transporting ATPase subunit F
MRLASIEGIYVKDLDDIKKAFDEAVENDDIGIIIITESILEKMKDRVLQVKKSNIGKLIVTVPDRTGLKDKDFIIRYIKESVGIKI